MKISHISITQYKQFKNLELDLTYPKGHEKAGQPLDKICIIGQSGVGKTNLLEIIHNSVQSFMTTHNFKRDFFENANITVVYSVKDNDKVFEFNNLSFKPNVKVFNILGTEKILFMGVGSLKREDNQIWTTLKIKIKNYKKERLDYESTLFNKLMNTSYSKEESKIDMKEWESKNENVLEKMSYRLNSILNKFNLELTNPDENQKSYNDLIFKDLSNNEIINYDNLSTGTKNIISTFIPLKIHNPKDSIILIDEPENSFYPDIQRMLTELYMEVGENNQLIMATHSPLIASSFEPWEVVELKFDRDNQIYRELYFEGERHVDNYVLDPRMLTWTGILMDIFDLEESSNSNLREQKLIEFNILKEEIKNIVDIKQKEELFHKLKNMGKTLGLYNQ